VTAAEHARIDVLSERGQSGEISAEYANHVSEGALRLSQAHSLAAIALKMARTKS
jgi:hypothetical protein